MCLWGGVARGRGWGGGLVIDIRGGNGEMQKKESPDFRFPEVSISENILGDYMYLCSLSQVHGTI